ncbi:ABC transporter substrate-binding protein [Sinomonas sp. ASV486]|uniref:ABC transporter substrate-binding protein n=1 Tax=Sinomonas sp. ASV486 TaxID=3051170 RepID=UPI0027DB2210|nr:ABC transporter substrate-binding protein [Sinomonas sp. ASV486]MDQ4490873.1 ABC transporter substrate-binding protein [Sinomonas sp. ASV486]
MQVRGSRRLLGAVVLASGLALTSCTATPDARSATPAASGDGVLRLGLLLDSTGDSQYLNDAQRAAVVLAVQQANAAGGFAGKPVELLPAEIGTDTATGARNLAKAGADAVIGTTDSSRAPKAIDVLSTAKIPLISPANASAALSTYRSGGFYFRTAAPEGAEGAALIELARHSGAKSVAILRQAGGKAEADAASASARAAGLTESGSAEFTGTAIGSAAAGAKGADAVVVIAQGDGQPILAATADAGIAGSKLLLSSGLIGHYGSALANRALEGTRAVVPGVFPTPEFQSALLEHSPGLKDLTFAAEAYDAASLAVLAAGEAKDDGGASIAAKLTGVSGGTVPGRSPMEAREKCTGLPDCLARQARGATVDYDGMSGPIAFDSHGDITTARFLEFDFGADNQPHRVGEVTVAR